MKLSENLKRIRKEKNLSQEQLAEKIGVSRQAVSKWESGQSYPEMDKVLLICKLFDYNIDELLNENVKQIEENKQSKTNFNKYIDDFFAFITKTVDMLSAMSFKQKIKCILEQFVIAMCLLCCFAIIGSIFLVVAEKVLFILPSNVFEFVRNLLEVVCLILGLIVGCTILLHVFKIRYLDYYEISREETLDSTTENKIKEKEEADIGENNKESLFKREKEKIVIRDPEHSQSKFLNGVMKCVVWSIKFLVACVAIVAIITFVTLVILLVLSFLFVKTGVLFIGCFLALIASLMVNFIVLKFFYDFIFNKKTQKGFLALVFVIALILVGIGIGMILIGLTDFNYVSIMDIKDEIVEETYNFDMSDNLLIEMYNEVEYIESNSNDIKLVVKHSKYSKIYFYNVDERISIGCIPSEINFMESIRRSIKNINNRKFMDYGDYKIYVYASEENIERLKDNIKIRYDKGRDTEEELYDRIEELEYELEEKNDIIEELTTELY